MRLSAIHLHGFKSFRNATRIDIQRNPLAIVGPNGCGKSNIIDAIRWVLGESSARQLRGGAMADVISNGADKHAPARQAVVELLFDNTASQAPAPWTATAEIRVQRQLSRDGDSQYRINDARCRRRDVGDLFLGTGLGASAYAIVEQGTIGRIVESRPEDLRAMLEEAAGISRYRERRRETEQRIAETREHLQRLRDIHGEMEQQFQRLTRQAEQARTLRALRAEERRWQWWELTLHLAELDAERAHLQEQLQIGAKQLQQHQAEEMAVLSSLDALRKAMQSQEEQLREAQGAQYAAQAEQALAEQEWQRLQEDGKRLARARKEVQESRVRHDEEMARRTRQLEEAQARLQVLAEQERVHAEEEGKLRSERDALEQQLRAAEAAQTALHDKVQDWRRQVDVLETQWREIQPRIIEMEGRRNRLANRPQPKEGELQQRQARLHHAEQRAQQVQADLLAAEQLGVALVGDSEKLQDEWQTVRDQAQHLRAQREALQRLCRGLQKEERPSTATSLSAILRVHPDWEQCVEWVLGDRLHALLVDAIDGVEGSGSWLCPAPGLQAQGLPDDALWHHLQLDADWHRALLPWFWGLRCIPDLLLAEARMEELCAGEQWITPRGELRSRSGLWRLGREGDDASWLRVQRELQDIASTLPDLEARVQTAEEALREARGRLSTVRAQEQDLRRQTQAAQQELVQAREKLGQWESILAAEAQRAREETDELQRLEQELQSLQARHQALDQELQRQRARGSGLQQQEQESRRTVAERQRAQQEQRQRYGRLREEGQRRALERQRLENEQTSARERLQVLAEEVRRIAQQAEERERDWESWQGALPGAEQRRTAQREQREAAQQTLISLQGQGDELHQRQRALDQQRQALQAQQRQQEIEQAKQESRSDHLEERRQELLLHAQEMAAILGENPGPMPENHQPQAELQRVQAALVRLGNVNLAAEEELAELQGRQGDLAQQVADVDQALISLESAMAAMDAETLERFQHTLEQVNQKLQEYFAELFGGGQAGLERCAGDPLAAGLLLRAQPPGKRNGTLQQLSGGEKALTAIALVFAIFALNPAPFCILDEVDAPLDDANIERFCRLLRQLAQQTQFLLISHRHLTLQVAEQFVGVTMTEPGISSTVAVDVAAILAEESLSVAGDKDHAD